MAASSDSTRKNVVLITVDALRYDYLFGEQEHGPTPETPVLDELSETGVHYADAHSTGPATRQSFPGIMTSTYPWEYDGWQYNSLDGRPHLAEELSAAGYATGGFHSNEFLMTGTDYERGFDRFFGYESGFNRFLYFYENAVFNQDPLLGGDELTRIACEWLSGAPEPAFCWVHYMDVHFPYRPHRGTVSREVTPRRSEYLLQKCLREEELAPDERETLRTLYAGEIAFVDACIGALLDVVDRRFDPEETVVVFAADHGELLADYGHVGHPDILREQLVHVPFVIRDGSRTGTVETPVSTVDILPTVLEYAGLDVPGQSRGIALQSASPPPDRTVFAQCGTPSDGKSMAANAEQKLIRDHDADTETAYSRPDGETPIASGDDELRATLDEQIETIVARRTVDDENTRVDQMLNDKDGFQERLEALGYL